MGVLHLAIHNGALLTKWLWRLHDDENALWVKIVNHKYLANRIDNVFLSPTKHYSTVWRDISQNILVDDDFSLVLLNGISFDVRDGSSVLFWHDHWPLMVV